jgi:hypothetical protein
MLKKSPGIGQGLIGEESHEDKHGSGPIGRRTINHKVPYLRKNSTISMKRVGALSVPSYDAYNDASKQSRYVRVAMRATWAIGADIRRPTSHKRTASPPRDTARAPDATK